MKKPNDGLAGGRVKRCSQRPITGRRFPSRSGGGGGGDRSSDAYVLAGVWEMQIRFGEAEHL